MGMSGRINPKPTRSIKTVKNIIETDAFFIGMRSSATTVGKDATTHAGWPSLLLNYLHVLAQGALETGASGSVIVQGLDSRGAGLGQRRLRAKDVQLRAGAGGMPRLRQPQRLLRLFLNHLLRVQHLARLDEA